MALLLLAVYMLVDRDAPLVAGITVGIASRIEPTVLLAVPVIMAVAGATGPREAADGDEPDRSRLIHFSGALGGALFAAWVPTLAWGWDSLTAEPTGTSAPGGLGPGWVFARSLDQGLAGRLLGPGRPLLLALAVVPAVVWVRRRPRRVFAAIGLVLLAPLALSPAWSPRDLVWPVVFGYLGDARWASIYAVAAGATLLWTSTFWGSGLPWDGGVAAGTVPAGTVAGLGLTTWVVLCSWLVLGWRTVAVEYAAARSADEPAARPGPEAPVPVDQVEPAGPPGGAHRAPVPARPRVRPGHGTSPSRRSVSLPK